MSDSEALTRWWDGAPICGQLTRSGNPCQRHVKAGKHCVLHGGEPTITPARAASLAAHRRNQDAAYHSRRTRRAYEEAWEQRDARSRLRYLARWFLHEGGAEAFEALAS